MKWNPKAEANPLDLGYPAHLSTTHPNWLKPNEDAQTTTIEPRNEETNGSRADADTYPQWGRQPFLKDLGV